MTWRKLESEVSFLPDKEGGGQGERQTDREKRGESPTATMTHCLKSGSLNWLLIDEKMPRHPMDTRTQDNDLKVFLPLRVRRGGLFINEEEPCT